MDRYTEAVRVITSAQEEIVGRNVALGLAGRVNGLDIMNNEIHISRQPHDVLKELINEYKKLFGQASVEVCRDALHMLQTEFTKNELDDYTA
ncbi:hypothetical protein HYW61_01380 [candidate division WWE3 bacterium]|nr:hypothetical protein [candidate division WWE3 bacterium]